MRTVLKKQKVSDETDPAILAEYSALRTEMMKRIEFRYHFVNFTLLTAETFLAVAAQTFANIAFIKST